jgi:HK97 family phage portal protein
MSSEYKPPIVLAVNSDSPLSDEKERTKFINKYLKRSDKSAPLIIPADLMTVSQVKPLSLTDLAIKDGVELDKKTVASILDIPGFLLGVGSFNKDEYNTWISRRLLAISRAIEQELTKKLLLSEDRYFRFNARSLYSYSLQELSQIALNMRNAGLMTGNEGRNWLDLPPKDGLDELVMLENYLPADRLGDQKKLNNEKPETKEESPDV